MAAAGPAAQPPESLRPCCLGTVQRASSRPRSRCWASICAACVFCDRRRRGGALSHTRPSCAHAPLAPQCAIDLRWLARNSAPLSPTVCVRVQLAGPKSSIATVDFFFPSTPLIGRPISAPMPGEQRAPSEWWPEPERKAPAPEQDAFQRTPSEGTRRLSASVDINEGLWSPLARGGGEHDLTNQPDIVDPDWGSELNSGNRSWELRQGARAGQLGHGALAGQRGAGGQGAAAGERAGGSDREHAGFSQTGGPLHALQEQSFESLSSLSERELAERPGAASEEDQDHELSGMTWRGMSMDSAELRPVSTDMLSVQNDAVKRLAATEMKVDTLLREMAALKATGV